MSAIDRIVARVRKRNFDNDIVSILENLRRYRIADQPIQIGGSSLDGSMVEFLVATVEEIDDLSDKILALEKLVAEMKPSKPLKTEPAKEPDAPVEMQTTIDGGEEPHAEVAEKANPAPKKPTRKAK